MVLELGLLRITASTGRGSTQLHVSIPLTGPTGAAAAAAAASSPASSPATGQPPAKEEEEEECLPALVETLATRLRVCAGVPAPKARILRAWAHGRCCAKAVACGGPPPSGLGQLRLPNLYWVVLRAPGSDRPTLCTSLDAYAKATAGKDRDRPIGHGFASQTEALAFVLGFGLDELPEPWQPQR